MGIAYTILITLPALAFALMLPYGTNVPYSIRPKVTRFLIAINVAMHLVTQGIDIADGSTLQRVERMQTEITSMSLSEQYYDMLGLTPSKLRSNQEPWRWLQVVTANFVHGDWLHLLFNVWFFALFAGNLENLMGHRRFILFIIASLVASQLGVIFFTEGTPEAFTAPHLGFSGVVYATMAAYLVCFPRSKIRVILIYNVLFWIVALCTCAVAGLIAGLLLTPTLGQLVGLGIFVALFFGMQPGHALFGVPAFVFLGFRILQDAVQLENQHEGFTVSIWCHAGGFLAGVAAGLLANGTKGLSQTWGGPKLPSGKVPERKSSAQKAQEQIPPETPDRMARATLGRKIFQGDAADAIDYYKNTVIPKFPELTLDWQAQLMLARMLESRKERDAALHAYDNLFRAHPNVPGVETALISAARLCREDPDLYSKGMEYLNQFEGLPALMRERLEARQLRRQFSAESAAEPVSLASSGMKRHPVSVSDDVDLPDLPQTSDTSADSGGKPAVDEAKQKKQDEPPPDVKPKEPEVDPRIAAFIARTERKLKETSATPSETELTGWKPIAFKSAEWSHPDRQTPVQGRHRPIEPRAAQPPPTSHETPKQPSGSSLSPGPPREKRKIEISLTKDNDTRQPLEVTRDLLDQASRSGEEGPGTTSTPYLSALDRDMYRESALATPVTDAVPNTSPVVLGHNPRSSAAGTRTENGSYCVILNPGTEFRPTVLVDFLEVHLGSRQRADETLREGKGILLRDLSKEAALEARQHLQRAGVATLAVSQDHPAFLEKPRDAFSVTLEGQVLNLLGRPQSVATTLDEVAMLNMAELKLSPDAGAFRQMLEVVILPTYSRVQLWDRMLIPSACLVNGRALSQDQPIMELFRSLAGRVPMSVLTSPAQRALADPMHLARFDCLAAYESFIAYSVLSRFGTRLV